jgi:hypothetical protein
MKHHEPRREIYLLKKRIATLETAVEKLLAATLQLKHHSRMPHSLQEAANMTITPWPKDKPLKYNESGTPCDAWNGPCSCGAWHAEGV